MPRARLASAPTGDGKSRIVFKVTEITPAPAPTKAQRDTSPRICASQLVDEALSEYVVALQGKLGTTSIEAEFRRATGVPSETQ